MDRPNTISNLYIQQLQQTREFHKLKLRVELLEERLRQIEEEAKPHKSYKDRKLIKVGSTLIED